MILEVIEHSMDRPEIAMSSEVQGAMLDLRQYMFDNVYTSKVAKREEAKAKNILHMLFDTFMNQPEMLPESDRVHIDAMGTERVVIDYIAGMTDNYAVYKFNEIFVPKGWSLR